MKPRIALIFVVCFLSTSSIALPGSSPGQAAVLSTYPNSTGGLQKLVWDMLAAQKSGGDKALAPYLQALTLPNGSAWFSAAFGQENGAQLATFYDAWTNARNFQIAGDLARAAASQMADVAALSFARPGDSGATDKDNYFLGLLKQPQTFYVVNFSSANGASMRWAYFVYVDGAFRYLGPLADLRFTASLPQSNSSSAELARRVRVSANVEQARITHRVLPVYPPDALAERLEGSVDVHTIIGPDGTVQSVDTTSGNPVFVAAAEAAIRQWKFDPLLLNGQPVTVDTTITVNFHLPPSAAGAGPAGSSRPYPAIPSYPESPSGLTKMMKGMLALSGHGQNDQLSAYYHALAIPNPDAWFSAQFGDRDGVRFAASYQNIEELLPAMFSNILQTETGLKYDSVEVIRFRDACTADANETEYPILADRVQQTTALYEVRFMKNGGYRWMFPFAYVDGGFRYLGNLQIVAPPNNIMGTDIEQPKLIKEVQAVYPNGFNMPGNTGNVRLWGIVSADGTVRDLHAIRGTCPYVKATIDAVKKWRFKPLMVDGKPQDVVYPFEYNFGLNR